jgi:hypothetical protein
MPSGWQPGKPVLKPSPNLAGNVWKIWKPDLAFYVPGPGRHEAASAGPASFRNSSRGMTYGSAGHGETVRKVG